MAKKADKAPDLAVLKDVDRALTKNSFYTSNPEGERWQRANYKAVRSALEPKYTKDQIDAAIKHFESKGVLNQEKSQGSTGKRHTLFFSVAGTEAYSEGRTYKAEGPLSDTAPAPKSAAQAKGGGASNEASVGGGRSSGS